MFLSEHLFLFTFIVPKKVQKVSNEPASFRIVSQQVVERDLPHAITFIQTDDKEKIKLKLI